MSTLGSVEYSKAWAKSITNLKIKCVSVESTSAIGRRGNMKRIVFQKARQPRTKWAARYWWTVWRYIFCMVCQTTQIHDSNVLYKELKHSIIMKVFETSDLPEADQAILAARDDSGTDRWNDDNIEVVREFVVKRWDSSYLVFCK